MSDVKAIKIPIEFTEEDVPVMSGQSKICNWLYNQLLDTAITARKAFIETSDPKHSKIVYTKRGLRNLIPSLKEIYPFLKSVHSSPLKNTALRLSASIQDHQKSKKGKRKGKSGFPKFRSWKADWFSLLYDEPGKGFKVVGDELKISLGADELGKRLYCTARIREPYLLKTQEIHTLRIIRENGIFYAIFTISVKLPTTKAINKVIALDPNHKNFAYGVDNNGNGIEVAATSWLKIYDKRIDELKSLRDRCQKNAHKLPVLDQQGNPTGKEYTVSSKQWIRRNKTLQGALHKRREQSKTFMFTLAHKLCHDYDCIAIGDYTPSGKGKSKKMRRAMNNRSLIGKFKHILSWTAEKSGKIYFEYDEKNTTRECNSCKYCHSESLDPSIRWWQCPDCKSIHYRDENSAQNGLKKVLEVLQKKYGTEVLLVSGSDRVSVMGRWAWRVLPSGLLCIPRGQNCTCVQRQEIKLEA